MGEHLFFVGPGRAGLSLGYALWQAGAVESIIFCWPEDPIRPPILFSSRVSPGTSSDWRDPVQRHHGRLPGGSRRSPSRDLHGPGRPGRGAARVRGLSPLRGPGHGPVGAPLGAGLYGGVPSIPSSPWPIRSWGRPSCGDVYFAVSGEPAAVSVARRILDPSVHRSSRSRYARQTPVPCCSRLRVQLPRRSDRSRWTSHGTGRRTWRGGPAGHSTPGQGQPGEPEPAGSGPGSDGAGLQGRRGDGGVASPDPGTRERALYASLGLEILWLAEEGGLNKDSVEELREMFEREK